MSRERELYQEWVQHTSGDPEAAAELAAIREDEQEVKDRFYRDLAFGTAGMRGLLGYGTNRMNIYTVGRTTQGFANFLQTEVSGEPTVAIAYDSRICSDVFAERAAGVFAANGVHVYLYAELMPTPALSWAVRQLGCDGGVVITASHNPAQYNGYKTYGPDGCQIGPEQAAAMQQEINDLDAFADVEYMPLREGIESGLIEYISEEFVAEYVARVLQESLQPEVCESAGLKLVYTPLNGAGRRCVCAALEALRVENVRVVPEQEQPDGNFPTCPYPNPEMPEALELGLRLARESGGELLVATDPDCDRMAAAVAHGGEWRILSGNEMGVLLLDYICRTRTKLKKMPAAPFAVKSVVSTRLADAVARSWGVELAVVPTGFKFVGEAIAGLERKGEAERFILAFEESCGYMTGSYVRDKDAVNATAMLVEMASAYKLEGKTLVDVLDELHAQHGLYYTEVGNYGFAGAEGMERMYDIMHGLRESPPGDVAGDEVASVTDYAISRRNEMGRTIPIDFPQSNMMQFDLANGNSIIVRPSGTEPKIKAYYTIVAKNEEAAREAMRRYRASFEERLK